jgi:hypothetical protein
MEKVRFLMTYCLRFVLMAIAVLAARPTNAKYGASAVAR